MVTTAEEKTAWLWEAASWKRIGEPLTHGDWVTCAQFSPDGRQVITVSDDKTARLWDAASGKQIGEPLQHGDKVTSAQFSRDGERVLTAGRMGRRGCAMRQAGKKLASR